VSNNNSENILDPVDSQI